MLIYQLITKQKTYTHKIHFQLPYGIKGTHKLWRIGLYIYIYIYMRNVNKYRPMLVKVQKKPKKNVKKKSKNTSSSIYKAEKIR